MEPKFTIYVKTRAGQTFPAFTWTRDADSGCARARREAARFGHDVVEVWAIPHQYEVAA